MQDIRGSGGGGDKKQRTPVEAPDSLHSVAYARIDDLVSEGPIRGLADGLKSIFFNETALQNADGTLNFQNVQVDWRLGTQDQTPIPGFGTVENEIGVNVELKQDQEWTQSLTNTSLDGVRIMISTPALQTVNQQTSDINGGSVQYAIDVGVDGAEPEQVFTSAITGKTSTKYQRSHRIDLPPASENWTIRVRRLTPDSTSSLASSATFIDSYTELVDAKLRYPNSAHIATTIDAAQFPNIPNRAFDLYGFSAVPIPTNYNPDTREYSGIWDGRFKSGWTDNPAWLFYLLATHPRFGLGHLVASAQVNKWALYKIARWCDELVPTGVGDAKEPRITCNLFLQTQEDAYKVLSDLASTFRGITYWAGGQIFASADMPRDLAYVYTPSNVIDGKFSYSSSGKRARHTVALVSWCDPKDFYRPKVEYVEDREGIARFGINQTEVVSVGCTSQGQARRMGRAILTTERLESDVVTFGVGLDGAYRGRQICAPGQIIAVADPLRQGRRQGGRVAAATENSIRVDRLPNPAPTGQLNVILPDGRLVSRTIDEVDESTRTITVTQSFGAVPVAGSVWAADTPEVANAWYSVLSVTEDEPLKYTVTALYNEPDKYDYIDFLDPIEPRVPRPTPPSDRVPSVELTKFERKTKYNTETVVAASWLASDTAKQYEIQWRKDEGNWSAPVRQRELRAELTNARPGNYLARVSAILADGKSSGPTYSNTLLIEDDQLPPDAIGEFEGSLEELQSDVEVLEEIALGNQQKIADEIIERQRGDARLQAETDRLTEEQAVMRAQLDDIMNAPDWQDDVAYDEGSVVKYEGRLYRAKQDVPAGTPVTDEDYWEDMGEYESLAEKVGALAVQVDAHDTAIQEIDEELTAVSQTVSIHAARMPSGDGQLATEARVQEVEVAMADADEALGSRIQSIEARVPDGTDKFARSSTLNATTARVTRAEGRIDANASEISELKSELEGKADTTALNATNARVTEAEGKITANSSSIINLQAGLRDVSTVTNSGFEYDGEWRNVTSGNGFNYQSNSGESRAGSRYMRKVVVSGDGADTQREVINTPFTVESGHEIRFGGYVRAFNTIEATSYGVVAAFYDAAGELVGSNYIGRPGGSAHGWTRLERTIRMPAAAVSAHVRCRAVGHTSGTIGYEDLFAYPVDPATSANAEATRSLEARVESTETVNRAQATDISNIKVGLNNNSAQITQISQVVASAERSFVNIPNPGFEIASGQEGYGWEESGVSYSVAFDSARNGSRVLRHFSHDSTKTLHSLGRTKVTGLEKFRVTAWARQIGSKPNGNVNVGARAYNTSGGVISGSPKVVHTISAGSLGSNWVKLSGIYECPKDADTISIYTQASNTEGGIAMDDFTLERITNDVDTLLASWTVVLDVNGYISGIRSTNDGTKSSFDVVADKFRVIAPGGGARLEWSNNNLRVVDSNGRTRVRMGIW